MGNWLRRHLANLRPWNIQEEHGAGQGGDEQQRQPVQGGPADDDAVPNQPGRLVGGRPQDIAPPAAPNGGESHGKPHGSVSYSFNPAKQLTPPSPAASEQVRFHGEEIERQYRTIVRCRDDIHSSFVNFKRALGLPDGADLPACFKAIKKAAGQGSQIKMCDENPPRLNVDEETWQALPEEYRTAIAHFNAMLQKCHQFLQEKQVTLRNIEQKLELMNRYMKSRACVKTHNQYKDIPGEIEKFAAEMQSLIHDIGEAKCCLKDSKATGLKVVLVVDH